MSNPPNDQNNQNQWNQQTPPNYNQQVPPQGGYQQMPPQGGYQQYPPQGGVYGMQEKLPNSGGILTLGILGIVLAGGIGVILSIIAIIMASGAINTYNQNPDRYTLQSLSRVKAGRTCAIIGLCLFVIVIMVVVAANS